MIRIYQWIRKGKNKKKWNWPMEKNKGKKEGL